MVKTCKNEQCSKRASFCLLDTKEPLYCKDHIPDIKLYISVKKARDSEKLNSDQPIIKNTIKYICIYENCDITPTFGLKEDGKKLYCSKHNPNRNLYVDLSSKFCQQDDCKKHAIYGVAGTKVPLYCSEHGQEHGYINIKNKQCEYANCTTKATFGEKKYKNGSNINKNVHFCVKHKPDGYVSLSHKLCDYEDCYVRATFGGEDNKVKWCVKHKDVKSKDVVSKKCLLCNQQATYGSVIDRKLTHCSDHGKPLGLVNIKTKKCINKDCTNLCMFGYKGYSPEYCSIHMLPRMVYNPTSYEKEDDKKCDICLNSIHYNETRCSYCQTELKIEKEVFKKKENEIKELLELNNVSFVYDKIVYKGCSSFRPDFFIQTKWGTIVLEVDEHQHMRHYNTDCELTRMKQIFYDTGEMYLLFIRYNPDNYDGKIIYDNKNRKKILIDTINKYMNTIPEYNLSVIYLFYNGFDMKNNLLEKVDVI